MMKNPFTPTFGAIPVAIAGRQEMIDDVLAGLQNMPGDPNRSTIFVGPRGTGKTVLLAYIAERSQQIGWISANVTAGKDLLEEIMIQVRDKAAHLISEEALTHISEVSIANVSIGLERKEKRSSWRSVMTGIIRELNAQNVGLLITIDEVTPKSSELETLVNTYQHFIREKRDVAVLMAGLPQNISLLLQEERMSFLRRAFRRDLEDISFSDMAYAIRDTVEAGGREITPEALERAAEASAGYAYMMQLIGYHMWKQSAEPVITKDDVEAGIRYADHDLRSTIFDAVYRECSPRERDYLKKLAEYDGAARASDIAKSMNTSTNNGAQIRRRLIEAGVIRSKERGYVDFDIPAFRTYLRNM